MKGIAFPHFKCPGGRVLLTLALLVVGCIAALADTEADKMAATYPQLTNLPTVYIDTENGASITSTSTYVRATMHYVDADGITVYDTLNIRGRGNSTWNLSKKPYRIKFEQKTKFLGADRAKAKSWTLLANYADKTLIRNAVASCVGTFAGQPFTPAARFVDLVLNGTYLGNYQISDQIDVRKKRVNITEQKTAVTDDDDISGGYLVEVDGFSSSEPVHFSTANQGVAITIKSPDSEVISKSQISYISDVFNAFEDALFSTDFTDPEKGWRAYVDSSTLASWYLASELTANVDCFWSTYMYKEKGDDHLYWGPLWDFDIAFNNCTRAGDTSEALMVNKGFGAALAKKWAIQMWKDPWFVRLIARRWRELVAAGIEDHVVAFVDSVANSLEASQTLNYEKWPINKRAYEELVLFSTYAEGITYLKTFIHKHCAYLTDVLAEQEALLGDKENAGGDGSDGSGSDGENGDTGKGESSGGDAENGADDESPVYFEPNPDYLYRLCNSGSGLYADVSDDVLVLMDDDEQSATQQWYFEPADAEGYYRIVNQDRQLVVSDADADLSGKIQGGWQLALASNSPADETQQWRLKLLTDKEAYVVENKSTGLAWNNRGGGTTAGTQIIAWTSDENNVDKPNRQWRPLIAGLRVSTSLQRPTTEPEYAVTYVPATATLHFLTADERAFAGATVTVSDLSGRTVLTAAVARDVDVSALPRGIYVAAWTLGGNVRTVKFER